MMVQTIDMSVDYGKMGLPAPSQAPTLTTYLLDKQPREDTVRPLRPAVIVCPGGAYAMTCSREGEPVALRYCAAGFHSFVLNYSCAPVGWPAAACELSKAIAYVRSIADDYGIDKDKIIVCGFSAGGHLTASIGVYWDNPMIQDLSGVVGEENRPNGLVLCYPVILDDPAESNIDTIRNFIGENEENRKWFGLDKRVTAATPPAFLWHTVADKGVPVACSMKFADALRKCGVPFEMQLYPDGAHGLSLADETTSTDESQLHPEITGWMQLSIDWINRL